MLVQWRRRGRWWYVVATLAAAAWASAGLRLPREVRMREVFPGAAPHAVAHLAADWSTHPQAGAGAWAVERERANYTSWEYAVRYECGARCEGRAQVRADDDAGGAAPRHGHGHAKAHRVVITQVECANLPLLPWPTFCDETETTAEVSARAGGALLEVHARAACGVARTLAGRCARALLERTQRQMAAIRRALS